MARLSEFGADYTDLCDAFASRYRDYECLRDSKHYAGAVIMGLFALEILLKCLICRNLREARLPRVFEVHDLQGLLIMAGLRWRLESFPNSSLQLSWAVVREWGEKSLRSRYLPDDKVIDPFDWACFHTAIEDPTCGVIPWLRKHLTD